VNRNNWKKLFWGVKTVREKVGGEEKAISVS
jgi:hypothetical protein